MERTRIRTVAGLIVALAAGAFGPMQAAVSHESATHVEISGPLLPDDTPDDVLGIWTQSKRGAEGYWQVVTATTRTYVSLIVGTGDDAEVSARTDEWRAKAENDRRAAMRVTTCTLDYYSCTTQTWRGADTFSHDLMLDTASFVGTLADGNGGTCDVDATWTANGGHNVWFTDAYSQTHPRTRRAATLDVTTSCAGTHHVDGPGEAAIWTDHIVVGGIA